VQLTILARGTGWHVQDLQRAAADRSINVIVAGYEKLVASEPVGWAPPTNQMVGGVHPPKAILVRMMPPGSLEQVIFRMDVLHSAQARGDIVLNPPRALETCIDKFLTTHRLAMAGLRVPRTWVGQTANDAMTAFERLSGEVVVKPLFGSEGHGVERVNDSTIARKVFSNIEAAGGVLYLQEFILHAGWDLRVFVIDNQVIAAMKRYAADGWRSNIALGGRAERVILNKDEEKLAIDAATAVGCPIAGVDLLRGKDGMYVIEVNAVPGWQALSEVSGADVAEAIIDYVFQVVSG